MMKGLQKKKKMAIFINIIFNNYTSVPHSVLVSVGVVTMIKLNQQFITCPFQVGQTVGAQVENVITNSVTLVKDKQRPTFCVPPVVCLL